MDGKMAYLFRVYINPEGDECFIYKIAEDGDALRAKAYTKKVFAFGQRLLDFLYLDIEQYTEWFEAVAADAKKLIETQDESLVPQIKKGLDKIEKLHIYFKLLRMDWYARLDRLHHHDNLEKLFPYEDVANIPIILPERQSNALDLIHDVLDFCSPEKPVGEKMVAYYAEHNHFLNMPFHFSPVTTCYERVDGGTFARAFYPTDVFDLLSYSLELAVEREQVFKQCKSCGKYFALTGYSTTEYCDREYQDTGKTCREIGANVSYQRKMEENPAIAAYNKAYKKKFARIRRGKMKKEDFQHWAELARGYRDECTEGKMTLEKYLRWLEIE